RLRRVSSRETPRASRERKNDAGFLGYGSKDRSLLGALPACGVRPANPAQPLCDEGLGLSVVDSEVDEAIPPSDRLFDAGRHAGGYLSEQPTIVVGTADLA